MILAHNLNTAMKRMVLGKDWVTKRMKVLRFHLIGLPGRVVSHARRLIILLGAGDDYHRPSDHPGAGMWTGRMIRERHLHHAARAIAGYLLGCRCGPMPAWQAIDSPRLHIPPGRLAIRATPSQKPVITTR